MPIICSNSDFTSFWSNRNHILIIVLPRLMWASFAGGRVSSRTVFSAAGDSRPPVHIAVDFFEDAEPSDHCIILFHRLLLYVPEISFSLYQNPQTCIAQFRRIYRNALAIDVPCCADIFPRLVCNFLLHLKLLHLKM